VWQFDIDNDQINFVKYMNISVPIGIMFLSNTPLSSSSNIIYSLAAGSLAYPWQIWQLNTNSWDMTIVVENISMGFNDIIVDFTYFPAANIIAIASLTGFAQTSNLFLYSMDGTLIKKHYFYDFVSNLGVFDDGNMLYFIFDYIVTSEVKISTWNSDLSIQSNVSIPAIPYSDDFGEVARLVMPDDNNIIYLIAPFQPPVVIGQIPYSNDIIPKEISSINTTILPNDGEQELWGFDVDGKHLYFGANNSLLIRFSYSND